MTPTIAPARPELLTEGIPARRAGWIERATSADHKSVGLLYLGGAFAFLAVAVTELVLLRLQLIVPENTLINPVLFDRISSTSAVTAALLFALPLAIGLYSYVVPLQIGARGVALPRVNLLGAWLYLGGAAAIYASFAWRPPEAGFAAMPPLSNLLYSPTNGVDAWILGVGMAVLGFVCSSVNMVTTLRNMRAPGMAWRRVPPFSLAGAATSWLMLLAGPVMLAALTMLMIDRRFDGIFFNAIQNGAPLYYQHLAWIFFNAAYAAILIFAFGVALEVAPTFARKPLFSLRAAAICLPAVAALAVLAWMQNMYTAPIPNGFRIFAMVVSLALVVPVGLLFVNVIATLWGGALRPRGALLFAVGGMSVLSLGLAGELMYSVIPVGWQLDNTTAAQVATVDVLVGGGVLCGFAALHYWLPKLCGRAMAEGPAKAALALILVGAYAFDAFMFLAGVKGQPADIYKFFQGQGLDGLNVGASVAAFVLAAGVLLELANAAWSWRNGRAAGHDPWGGATLEWFALSPPPVHNFDAVPDVRSATPLHDIREFVRRRAAATGDRSPQAAPAPAASPAPEPARADPGTEGGVPVS